MFNTKKAPKALSNCSDQAELKVIFRVQKMKPQCYDISPCRKIISIGYSNKQLMFWDLLNCQKTNEILLTFIPIQIFYSDDGKYQLIRAKETHKIIYLLEIQTQKCQTIIAQGCCLFSTIILFNSNYEAIVLGLQEINQLSLKNKGKQKQIHLQSQSLCPFRRYICSINCEDDFGELGVYKISEQSRKLKSIYVNVEKGNVNLCANSQFIICSSRAKNRVWNTQTMKLIRKKYYGNYEIKELIINHLVYFSINEIGIVVWNVGTGRQRIIVKGTNLVSIRAIPNGQLLYRSNWQINLMKIF